MKRTPLLALAMLFWYSTNPSVVSIDPITGTWTHVAPGKATICVQYESLTQCIDVDTK